MNFVAAVDPGINESGAAVFYAAESALWPRRLRAAALIRNPAEVSADAIAARAVIMAEAIADWIKGQTFTDSRNASVIQLVIEWPQIYTRKKSKGDPNDLPHLAAIGVGVACQLHCPVTQYRPREWKGTIDGDACTKRILERLTPVELDAREPCPASLAHNREDAIGIGLKYLGRFERLRVFPR